MKAITLACMIIIGVCVNAYADVNDYLILEDIGQYKHVTQEWHPLAKVMVTVPPYIEEIGASRNHFWGEHLGNDVTYKTTYKNTENKLRVEVQVTQHSGGESDRWLLHELEGTHRFDDDDKGLVGMLEWGTVMFNANGQRVLFNKGHYQWLSGSKVIDIKTEVDGKPIQQPVFLAYLAKHPSTMTMTDSEMKSVEHTRLWLKDEVERRLWLCDKWLEAFAAGKVEVKDLQYELNDNVKVVLLITGKYYDKSVSGDLERLEQYYYFARDTEGMKKMLSELKVWWTSHKEDTPDVPSFDEAERRQEELLK